MILYHGSNLDIASINLNMCRPYKDFGKGFYLTSMEEQARKMAHRVSKIYGGPEIVNVYEITDDFLRQEGLHIQDFGTTITEEWAAFVMCGDGGETRTHRTLITSDGFQDRSPPILGSTPPSFVIDDPFYYRMMDTILSCKRTSAILTITWDIM